MQIKKRQLTYLQKEGLRGYLFISPWVIGFLFFTFVPMLASLYLAFTDYNALSPPNFIGVDNFRRMVNMDSRRFFGSLRVTFTYVFTLVPLRLSFALLLAVVLNRGYKGIGLFRTIFYVPSLLGGSVAIAILWRQIFGSFGLVNALLGVIGIESNTAWTNHPSTAMPIITLLGIWQFGASMLIFLAGLKQIPSSYYEAARIDGANKSSLFLRITLPCLSPVILFNLVMQTINAFRAFNEAFLITGGGPFDSTLFYGLFIYQHAFIHLNMGYASALSWVMLLIISIFAAIIFMTSSNWVYYENK